MKSRQIICLLLFSAALNLSSFAMNTFDEASVASKKVFILLRSEENTFHIEKFKNHINNDLAFQNVSVQIEAYKRSEPLPQARIFKMAYSGDYDVILLIDQVAKYNIDNRVTHKMIKMGSKYKIRSYDLKKSPYIWKDHGNSNCNLAVDLSLKQFSEKILGSIDIEPSTNKLPENNDALVTLNTDYDAQRSLYIALLGQLNEQKRKTKKVLYDVEIMKSKLRKRQHLIKN